MTTPITSPQCNGMAESFVKTLKRDYAKLAERPDSHTVMAQLSKWLDNYNLTHVIRNFGPWRKSTETRLDEDILCLRDFWASFGKPIDMRFCHTCPSVIPSSVHSYCGGIHRKGAPGSSCQVANLIWLFLRSQFEIVREFLEQFGRGCVLADQLGVVQILDDVAQRLLLS